MTCILETSGWLLVSQWLALTDASEKALKGVSSRKKRRKATKSICRTMPQSVMNCIQEQQQEKLKYKAVLEKTKSHERKCLEYKHHASSFSGANSTPSYNNPLCLLMLFSIFIGPVALVKFAIDVANLTSKAIALLPGKSAANVEVIIISKLFVLKV